MHTDVCSVECALEVRPLEVRPLEVRPLEVRPLAVRPLAVRPLAVRPLAVRPLEVRRAWTAPEHGRHGWLDGLRLKHEQIYKRTVKSNQNNLWSENLHLFINLKTITITITL